MPYQIKNGKVYGSNAVSLTQAQYDALSTAEKNNGTVYYIYDAESVLDASDVSLGSGNVEDLAGSVAVIETSPATATHAVGSYLVYNGQLYKVTSAISAGATLTPGTNILAVNVGDELTLLIKTIIITGTTDGAGNVGAGSTSTRILLGAIPDRRANANVSSALITTTAAGTSYMLHCIQSGGAVVANQEVKIICTYIDGSIF